MKLFDDNLKIMQTAMDLRMQSQRIISANMANVDTPGYKAQELDFEASIRQAMDGVDAPAKVGPTGDPTLSLDGNNVSMEGELSKMSRNKLLYNVTSQLMAAKFRQINTMIDMEK